MPKSGLIIKDSAEAKQHTVIAAFAELVATIAPDGILDFTDLQERPFHKFWKNLILYRYLAEEDDFTVILFGTSVAQLHGNDWTGKRLGEIGIGAEGIETVRAMNKSVLESGEPFFGSGAVNLDEDDYRRWHQMKLPLRRGGKVNEVLVCMASDEVA